MTIEAGIEGRAAQATRVAVSVRNVDMSFADFHAVKDASFDLEDGRFLTILGPSGSGKTTLLRMIAGFQKPSAGEIFINGKPVSATPPHKRSIGMVFQKLALFPHMTAAENVAFPLKMRRFDATTIPERVQRYLDLVHLGGYADRRIHQLSGGQQQRVAIARALVFEPDLLLLDEPLAALDRKLREEMQLEFRRIQRELGVTTINVTHDQREALVVSDEVIVMDKGVIQQKAPPSATYRTPANAFVAGFIGVTNFISGKVTATSGDAVSFDVGGSEVTGTWAAQGPAPSVGASVTGALRAEQVRLASSEAELSGCQTTSRGVVRDAIFEGERLVYEIDLAPGTLLRVFDHDPAAHKQFAIGDNVAMGWNARDVLTFPN
ncbi:ABC transporter ATP-binding protein [Devosia sp. Root413D1]|uniref:ABC transporter ATP-binding protein n=1 Tax=unclassified Devosia TaxID=196773 RepID=UPI0006FDA265|nr:MULTISPECIES: ABC transporter ATP-binding protein [unclassified Devosia]KQU99285.1 ABC transporter ATP-binding protein [Devosia sp. Root105]KQW81125.1 ABC transporter ATP-binding protein [Devosia sp. Root413D1]